MTHDPSTSRLVAAVTTCLLAFGACGSDDNDAEPGESASDVSASATTTSADPTDSAVATTARPTDQTAESTRAPSTSATATNAPTEPALCGPYLQVSAAFTGEPDPATIGGLLDQVDAAAPTDLVEQLTVLTGGARTVLETGDFTVFEAPDFNAAIAAADAWVVENCQFVTTTEIIATDYQYQGQANAYPAGRTAFALVNDGAEAHELAIIRKNDGVDLTLDELLELPEDEAETMTTYLGGSFVGPTGARSNLLIELTPGNYIAVCNIAAGTIVADDGSFTEGAGQPHVMLGMSFEFAVT
jgi:hypothetical protein